MVYHKCGFYPKRFLRPSELERHIRTHTSDYVIPDISTESEEEVVIQGLGTDVPVHQIDHVIGQRKGKEQLHPSGHHQKKRNHRERNQMLLIRMKALRRGLKKDDLKTKRGIEK